MSAIDDLKAIVASQKTIRTSRLAPVLKTIETMYIQQGKKIKKLQNQVDSLNKKVSRQTQTTQ